MDGLDMSEGGFGQILDYDKKQEIGTEAFPWECAK